MKNEPDQVEEFLENYESLFMTKQMNIPNANPEYNLLPCPFCGSVDALKVCTDTEIEMSDYPLSGYYIVVCAAGTNGGCGASSGYYEKKEDAIEKWNRRTPYWPEADKEESEAAEWQTKNV